MFKQSNGRSTSQDFACGDDQARSGHYGGCRAAIGSALGRCPPLPKMRSPT